MKPATVAAALLLIAAGTLAGCLGAGKNCSSRGSSNFRGQELRVLDHGAWDYAYSFIKPIFENRTHAKLVQIKGEDAGAALKQAIDSKGRPIADVIYGVDNVLFFDGARAGIFEPYESPRLASIDTSLVNVTHFRSNGSLLATPVDHGYITVNFDAKYEEELAANQLPSSLRDLTDPSWAPSLVVEDPRLSSPGLGFLLATVATFGETGDYTYLDYWADLLKGGALVTKDWSEAYVVHFSAGYGKGGEGFIGDRTLVVSYSTSPAAEVFFGQLDKRPSASLEPPRGSFHQVEAAAILKCTRHLPLAKAFIDLLLESDYQNAAAANMAVYPVVQNATVPEPFTTYATAPEKMQPARFAPETLEKYVPKWLDEWTKVYQAYRA